MWEENRHQNLQHGEQTSRWGLIGFFHYRDNVLFYTMASVKTLSLSLVLPVCLLLAIQPLVYKCNSMPAPLSLAYCIAICHQCYCSIRTPLACQARTPPVFYSTPTRLPCTSTRSQALGSRCALVRVLSDPQEQVHQTQQIGSTSQS